MSPERVTNGRETIRGGRRRGATASDFYREIRTVAATRKGGRDETTQQIRFMFRKRLRLRAKAVITRAVRTMTTRLSEAEVA